MKISRRKFLGTAGATAVGGVLAAQNGYSETQSPIVSETDLKGAVKTTTICPYCGVGCGIVVYQKDGKIINVEGDPEHPINEGSLCSKGNALYQVANNDRRLQKVLYRAPGSSEWQEKSWDWALPKIAANIKATRDKTFREKEGDRVVNRTEGIACLGGAALDNEECYLLSKFMRGLGVTYLEHQARI
jgi:formate dehydrogenase major subunit